MISWVVDDPYQSVIVVEGGAEVFVRDLGIVHASPSVANDFAVHVRGGSLTMERCSSMSLSGAGVCVEGGFLALR